MHLESNSNSPTFSRLKSIQKGKNKNVRATPVNREQKPFLDAKEKKVLQQWSNASSHNLVVEQ